MTVVGSPQELGMEFLVTSDSPPTPTVVEPLPSKGSSYLQYGVSFMMIMGYFVSLQLILIPFLLLTMPQEIGLLEIKFESSMANDICSSDSEDSGGSSIGAQGARAPPPFCQTCHSAQTMVTTVTEPLQSFALLLYKVIIIDDTY